MSTNERYNSLSIGVETSILEVSEDDFSKWIKDCYTKTLSLETIESDLVNTKITSSIASVAVKLTNNEFVVHWLIKLGNTYFEVEESLGAGFDDDAFTLTFMRPLNESQLQMLLMDDFISNLVNTGYVSYLEGNKSIILDFSSVSMTSNVENLTFKRIGIVNNKLTFFLEKAL